MAELRDSCHRRAPSVASAIGGASGGNDRRFAPNDRRFGPNDDELTAEHRRFIKKKDDPDPSEPLRLAGEKNAAAWCRSGSLTFTGSKEQTPTNRPGSARDP